MFVGIVRSGLVVAVPRVVVIVPARVPAVPVVAVAGDDVTLSHRIPLAHTGGGSTPRLVVPCWHLGSTNVLKYKNTV